MTFAPSPCVVLLAAGQSRRMGGETPTDKLLLPITRQGVTRSLLADRIATVMASGLNLLLVLPPETDFPTRWNVALQMGVTAIPCPRAHLGMGESLATAFSNLGSAYDCALVMLADMPEITAADLIAVARKGSADEVWRGATGTGKPGHPVRIPRRLFGKMQNLTGDQGAQVLLRQEKTGLVPLPDSNAVFDLDSPEDWERYCARNSSSDI